MDDLDHFVVSSSDPFRDLVSLYDGKTHDLLCLRLFLDIPSLRLFRASSEDDSEPDSGNKIGVEIRSFTDAFTFCITILETSRAVGAVPRQQYFLQPLERLLLTTLVTRPLEFKHLQKIF